MAGGEIFDLNFDKNSLTGWYYDEQLNNPLLSVSLHPSCKYLSSDETISDKEYDEILSNEKKLEDFKKAVASGAKDAGYKIKGFIVTKLKSSPGSSSDKKTNNKSSNTTTTTSENEETFLELTRTKWLQYTADDDVFKPTDFEALQRTETQQQGIEPPVYYRRRPLCSAILTDDFNVSIANSWTDFGSNPIGRAWESVKSIAPYASFAGNALDTIYDKQKAYVEKEGDKSTKFSKAIEKIVGAASGIAQIGTGYLNKSLIVQGSQFSYYSGTGVSFSNLGLRLTLFPKFEDGEIKTVNDQLNELYPYLIGSYLESKEVDWYIKANIATYEKVLNRLNMNKAAEALSKFSEDSFKLSDYVGWQDPPGGYQAQTKNIDTLTRGTMMLRLGAHYAITNLVVQDATFNFSKQMVKLPKDPGEDGSEITISPLYCDLNITLRPSSLYSDTSLRWFTGAGAGNNSTVKKDLEYKINENLKSQSTYAAGVSSSSQRVVDDSSQIGKLSKRASGK